MTAPVTPGEATRTRALVAAAFAPMRPNGDIDIEAHRDWELGVAGEAGMQAVLPLWGCERDAVLADWWRLGFEARIVVARDGVEALDYVYHWGNFAERPAGNPVLILLDLSNYPG